MSMKPSDACRRAVGEGVKIDGADIATKNMRVLIGSYDFGKISKGGYYFADKTLLIRDLIEHGPAPIMITRPRRSGKSLGLSTIDHFFSVAYAEEEAERDSFAGLKIEQCLEYPLYAKEYRNRYPVVRLSFNNFQFDSAEEFKEHLNQYISNVVEGNFEYLEASDRLSVRQRSKISRIMDGITGDVGLALQNVCELLKIHHGLKPMLLIDEYDKPLSESYGLPYFETVARSYGSFLESIVKANEHTSFVVMTGVQKIVAKGMVSGLNNVCHCGVLSERFAEHFGLTPDEAEEAVRRQVDDLFPDWSEEKRKEYADRKYAQAKEWYDGYRIGGHEIFNPLSITSFIDECIEKDLEPKNYWNDTSANDILVDVLGDSGEDTLDEVKRIYSAEGGQILGELDDRSVLWCKGHRLSGEEAIPYLLSTGYLTAERVEGGFRVTIPNEEVRQNFDKLTKRVLDVAAPQAIQLIKHIVQKDANLVKEDMEKLMSGKSYLEGWDEPKFRSWLSTVFAISGYRTVNEHASGNGRSDILIRDHKRNPPLLVELKYIRPDDDTELEKALNKGIGQIVDQGYADGYQLPGVIALAMAVKKKSCAIRFLRPRIG